MPSRLTWRPPLYVDWSEAVEVLFAHPCAASIDQRRIPGGDMVGLVRFGPAPLEYSRPSTYVIGEWTADESTIPL